MGGDRTETADAPPRIDTIWRARDGRRFRVRGTIRRGIAPNTSIGVLLVSLPPLAPRQRRETEIDARYFGACKFLSQEAVTDAE